MREGQLGEALDVAGYVAAEAEGERGRGGGSVGGELEVGEEGGGSGGGGGVWALVEEEGAEDGFPVGRGEGAVFGEGGGEPCLLDWWRGQ